MAKRFLRWGTIKIRATRIAMDRMAVKTITQLL
jgi:hypothetical protein